MVDRSRSTNSGNRRIPGAERAVDLSRAREREVEPDVLSRPVDAQEAFTPYFPNGINLIDASEEEPTFVTITVDDFTEIAGGIEAVAALPTLPDARYGEGVVVFLTTDDKLYRSNGVAWSSAVPTTDLTGQITTTQITDLAITTPKLEALAVTTAKLDALAVTAGKIDTNAVTADKILAGAVTTSKLDADAVTAAKLSAIAIESGKYIQSTSYVAGVSGWKILADGTAEFNNVTVRGLLVASQADLTEATTLVTNGDFGTNVTGWTGTNCTVTRETGAGLWIAPTGSAKLSSTAGGDMSIASPTGLSAMPVVAGQPYNVRGFVQTAVSSRLVRITVTWYDAAGATSGLGTSAVGDVYDRVGSFVSCVGTVTPPTGAAFASLTLTVLATGGASEVHYWDAVFMGRVSNIYGNIQTSSTGKRTTLDSTGLTLYPARGYPSAPGGNPAVLKILDTGSGDMNITQLVGAQGTWGSPTLELEGNTGYLDLSSVSMITGLPRIGCTVARVANQAIVTGTDTAISWDTETYDPSGFITVTSATVTIPAGLGGIYATQMRGDFGTAVTGRCFIDINIGGVVNRYSPGSASDFQNHSFGITGPLVAGTTITIDIFHSTGSNRNWTGQLTVYRLAP